MTIELSPWCPSRVPMRIGGVHRQPNRIPLVCAIMDPAGASQYLDRVSREDTMTSTRECVAMWVLVLLFAWVVPTWCQAESSPTERHTFVRDDGEVMTLPEGMEILPDGTVLKDGVAVGHYQKPPAEVVRQWRMHRFAGTWTPFFIYFNDSRLFAPLSLDQDEDVYRDQAITGLVTAPAGNSFIYAITGKASSRLMLGRLDPSQSKTVAVSDSIGEDAWFHGAMSLSPDGRWLLVTVSAGRQEAVASCQRDPAAMVRLLDGGGDLWLVDCAAALIGPRKLLTDVTLLDCCWLPSGRRAACHIQPAGEGEESTAIVDAESGAVRMISGLTGRPVFSLDGHRLRFYSSLDPAGEVAVYDLESQQIQRVQEGWRWNASPGASWSTNGDACAFLSQYAEGSVLTISASDGGRRRACTPGGIKRLLGWSAGRELLAYIATDNALRVCSGTASEGGYERLMNAHPPTPAGVDASESRYKSAREGMSLDTTASPLKVGSADLLLSAWATGPDGPCLVYADTENRCQRLKVLRFRRLSLEYLGLDLRRDYRGQMAESLGKENMETVASALQQYARDHDGRLPPHSSGTPFENDLRPYLDYIGRMRAVYEPDRSAVTLLVAPGTAIKEIAGRLQSPQVEVKIAEFRGEDGLVFAMIAKPTPESLIIDPGTLYYEIVSSRGE